jgi:hypothetical protein
VAPLSTGHSAHNKKVLTIVSLSPCIGTHVYAMRNGSCAAHASHYDDDESAHGGLAIELQTIVITLLLWALIRERIDCLVASLRTLCD